MCLVMSKGNKIVKFSLNRDASYRIWKGTGWSITYPDFADAYIKLREAGFIEVS